MFGGAAVAAAISEAASLVGKGAIMRDVASTFMAPLPAAATVQISSELLRAGRGLTAVQVDFIDSASGRLGSRHMIGFSSAVPSRL
jgi:acyl-CoA thioesterase